MLRSFWYDRRTLSIRIDQFTLSRGGGSGAGTHGIADVK